MARIYANENFPTEVVECLRQLGHDVLTTYEAGKANQAIPDEEVLSFATAEQRIVLTFNRKDFFRLHHQNQFHAGIIACTEDVEFAALANRIHEAIESQGDNLDAQVIRVNRPNLS
jgi:predicted nuclease of predicted toxin-antitoxin system